MELAKVGPVELHMNKEYVGKDKDCERMSWWETENSYMREQGGYMAKWLSYSLG